VKGQPEQCRNATTTYAVRQLAAGGGSAEMAKSPSCPLHGRAVGSIFVWDAAQFDICHTNPVKIQPVFRTGAFARRARVPTGPEDL
jgi:hypothetical protein